MYESAAIHVFETDGGSPVKAIGKILKALFYFFVFLVFYNMVDLYLCHMSRDFTNFEHSIFSSNGNAPEAIRSEIFESLQISDDGRPLSEPDKMDTFVEKHFSPTKGDNSCPNLEGTVLYCLTC